MITEGFIVGLEKEFWSNPTMSVQLTDADVGREVRLRNGTVCTLTRNIIGGFQKSHPYRADVCSVRSDGRCNPIGNDSDIPYDVVAFVDEPKLKPGQGGDNLSGPPRMPEPAGFTIKDSGERKQFGSGMVRDVTTGKTDWHRVADGPMLERWAEHLTKGAVKYPDIRPGEPNWLRANGVEELQRFRQSAFRHFMQWFMHDDDEDHAAAVFFNINGFEYTKARLADGTHETAA